MVYNSHFIKLKKLYLSILKYLCSKILFIIVRKDSANYSKGKLAVGYGVIALLVGAIVYLYISEWRQLEKLEQEAKHINVLRQKVH